MSSGTGDSKKLKVFISYSRKDLEFADQLVAVLKLQDFEPIIDRVGIHAAENWEKRLGQLILQADIVVFVLSPDSAASDICGWEVEEAVRRGKQVSPDGARITSGSYDKAVRIWPIFLTTRAIVAHGHKIAPRCLTSKQRAAFSLDPEPPAWCNAHKLYPYNEAKADQ